MQTTFPTQQAENDYTLLQAFLEEKIYSDTKLLLESASDDLVRYCFRQYYVFMFDSMPLTGWYKLYQQEMYKMLGKRNLSEDQAELHLRSSDFVRFAQQLMSQIVNQPNQATQPPASTSGEDLTHVCA